MVAFLLVAALGSAALATSPPFFRYAEQDLPKGGVFLQHPATGSRYYFVSDAAFAEHRENFRKQRGLYYSDASVQRSNGLYGLLNGSFDFRQVFIHPVTHKFFALIGWHHVGPGADGKIQSLDGGAYLAWSVDGVEWRDMTPSDGLLQKGARMTRPLGREDARIVQDPQHPKRICVTMLGPYGFVLRAVDDENSKWETVSLRDWQRQYPATAPASAPAGP